MISTTNLRGFHIALAVCMAAVLAGSPADAQRQYTNDPGFVLQRDDLDQTSKSDSLNAKDFYKLLDQSIGSKKFANAILIFGGCYTGDFGDAAKNSSVATSGPVAVFTASGGPDSKKNGEKNRWELCPDIGGANPYLNGVMESLAGGNPASTASETGTGAMQSAVNKINEKGGDTKPLTASHPNDTFSNNGGNIKLADKVKGTKYAILMIGAPESYVEWNQLYNEYSQLVSAGYKPDNIDILFGTGKRNDDQVPLLPNGTSLTDDEANKRKSGGAKVEGTEIPHKVDTPDGKTVDLFLKVRRPATFRNLRADLKAWMTVAQAGDGFFFKAEGHFAHSTLTRTADELDLSKNLAMGVRNGSGLGEKKHHCREDEPCAMEGVALTPDGTSGQTSVPVSNGPTVVLPTESGSENQPSTEPQYPTPPDYPSQQGYPSQPDHSTQPGHTTPTESGPH